MILFLKTLTKTKLISNNSNKTNSTSEVKASPLTKASTNKECQLPLTINSTMEIHSHPPLSEIKIHISQNLVRPMELVLKIYLITTTLNPKSRKTISTQCIIQITFQ